MTPTTMTVLPEVHVKYLAFSRGNADEVIERANKDRDDAVKRRDHQHAVLSEAFAQYVLTGIGVIRDNPWIHEGGRTYFSWRKYYAGLARELKRPLVLYREGHFLEVPDRRYTATLYASLLLMDPMPYSQWRWQWSRSGFALNRTSKAYRFYVCGEEAGGIIREHVASFTTDPAKRRALRL